MRGLVSLPAGKMPGGALCSFPDLAFLRHVLDSDKDMPLLIGPIEPLARPGWLLTLETERQTS